MNDETRITGLLGFPLGHTQSPQIHNEFYDLMNLNWNYMLFEADPKNLKNAVMGIKSLQTVGFNVTIPHKETIIPYLDELSERAKTIGAVNLVFKDKKGRLIGDNTDAPGFADDLAANKISIKNKATAVLGAGGAAKAITYALLKGGAKSVIILNRSKSNAKNLLDQFKAHFSPKKLSSGPLTKIGFESLTDCDLIVNCTPLGMFPNKLEMPWDADISFRKGQIVYDTVYNPSPTMLVKKARKDGARGISGTGMLHKTIPYAYEHWLERDFDTKTKKILEKAIESL